MMYLAGCEGRGLPTVNTCNFTDTEYGTIVYDQHGNAIGKFETHNAAVEYIREMNEEHKIGGTENGI